MTRKRSVANASALSAVALGVAGVMLGTGVTSTAIGVSDGVTWLPNSGSGEVLQFNPVTGQVEQSVPVGAPGERITVSQRDGMVVFTNEDTHEVSVFDMKQMAKSGKREVNATSTMLTSRDGMFLVNKGGQISRVDPATAEDLGTPSQVDGLVTAVVDEAGTVWAASEDGTVRSLKWSDRSNSLREVSSQKISGLGADAVLTAHEKGITAFGPDHGLIAQVGTQHDLGAVTDARMAGLVPAEHAPADLVPAALSSAGTVVVVDRGEVRDFALAGCARPTRPVAFNDVVYAVCEGQSKVVRVNRDGSPAGADIPTAGDSAPILDEGRLLLDVDGGAQGVEIDRKGNDKPYSRSDIPVAQVRDESDAEARQNAADRARADLEMAPPQDGAAGNGDGQTTEQDQTNGKDVVNGEAPDEPSVQELPAEPVDQNPSDRGNGRGNGDRPERDNRDHPGRGNRDNPGNQDPGNQDPGNGDPNDHGPGRPGDGEQPTAPAPDPTATGGPSAPVTLPNVTPSFPDPIKDPTFPVPGPTTTPTLTAKPTSAKPSPTKTASTKPSPTKTPTRTPTPTATKTTKPPSKTPTKPATTPPKPTVKAPTVKASPKGTTVHVTWTDVKADSYTVKVGGKSVSVKGQEYTDVLNVPAGNQKVTVTAIKGKASATGSTTVTVNKPKPTPTPTKTKTPTKTPTKAPEKKTVTVKKGERQNESYCTSDNCRAIMVSGTGFKPNSTVTCTVRKYDGFADHNVKVNAKGQIPSSQVGLFGYPDKKVSAVCDGTTSNTVTW